MKIATGSLLFCLVAMTHAQNRPTGLPWATRSEVLARQAMAATSQPLATQAALEILRGGGTAADAAIAANAVLGLVEPTGAGLGGDLFVLAWSVKEGRLLGLNGSGRSPAGLTLARLKEMGLQRIPAHGPLPVTVPGCADGWFALHARLGRLPMKEILAPAIRHAREGFPVTEVIAHHWAANARVLRRWPRFAGTFLPGGRPPAKGELFRNPLLAGVLERLGEEGRDAFYKGDVARAIAAACAESGGYLAEADLAAHRSEWVEPIGTSYRGCEVWELPPNGQGATALQMLNLLEGFDLKSLGFGSAGYVHLLVEAAKLAYADRARYLGDPAFGEIPLARLISKEYAAERRKRIDPERAAADVPPGDPTGGGRDTVYLATADAEGNLVSLIQSNYRGMGSGVTPAGCGFVLQDRGELFTLVEGRPNTYAPGKRPFHTIIPGFVTRRGKPFLCFGVMGGAMQPQGQVQVLVNLLDFGMNLQEAADAPRVFHTGSAEPTGEAARGVGLVQLEHGFPEDLIGALQKLGHAVEVKPGAHGGFQGILVGEGIYIGASESRKDGQAAGF